LGNPAVVLTAILFGFSMAGRIGFIRPAVDNLNPSFKLTDQLSDECDIGRLDCCATWE